MPDVSGASAVNTGVHIHYHYAHTRLRVHWAPGIPRALLQRAKEFLAKLGRSAPRERGCMCWRHSGAMRSIEPGISRFRVRSLRSRPGMTDSMNSLVTLAMTARLASLWTRRAMTRSGWVSVAANSRIPTHAPLPVFDAFSTPPVAAVPLTQPRRHGDYLTHEHRRPPIPSLVAHLLAGGRCDFSKISSSEAAIPGRPPCVCPVWRSLAKSRKRNT